MFYFAGLEDLNALKTCGLQENLTSQGSSTLNWQKKNLKDWPMKLNWQLIPHFMQKIAAHL